jgi:uncharacterized protein YkwD
MSHRDCVYALCVLLLAFWVAVCGAPEAAAEPQPAAAPEVPADVAQPAFEKYQAALDSLARGRTRAAMETLAEVTSLAPNWAEPRNILGFLHRFYNERARAIEQYEKVRALDPSDFHATQALVALGALTPEQAAADVAGIGVEAFEKQMVDLTNQVRTQAGLSPLTPSPELRKVALAHSQEMRDLGYFSHYSPTPGRYDVLARYRLILKKVPFLLGENLARRYGTENSLTSANIQDTFNGLMRSETHRRNILEPRYQEIAVAIVVNERGDYWMTQLFRREAP